MRLRYRSVLFLVAVCCLAFAAAPALAAKLAPTTTATVTQPAVPSPQNVSHQAAACQLGILPVSNTAFGYILPPDDAYFTLLNPADCSACPGEMKLTAAHVEHFYPLGELPCSIPVTISIVAAVDQGDGCYAPNPFEVLCGPQQYVISYPGVDDACVDFSFPLDCPCFTGPVFLAIEYDQGDCPSGRPAFCGQNPCTSGPCKQYNIYPGGNDDICLAIGRNITMYADADCCVVPTLPGSWGMVKTLYR